jgi:type I restriction enzyme, S subunit
MGMLWPKRKIKEFANVIGGGTPSKKVPDYFNGGISWITPKDLSGYQSRFISEGANNITELGLKKSSAKLLPKSTILFSSRAPIGYVVIANKPLSTNQGFRNLVCDQSMVSVDFVYYILKQSVPAIEAISSGATFKEVSGTILGNFEVPLPPLYIQKKIAAILSAYDDLIENNLRRITILEDMVQLIYREWFVHFRFPGHEKIKIVDSPLGKIPEGWEVKKLKDVLELKYGKALKKTDRLDGDVPVYGSSGIVGFHNNYLVQGPGIIVGRKGNVGSVFWSDEDFYPIDTTYFVSSILPLRFLFYELQNKNFINNDAAVPGLNRNQAYSLELVVPTDDMLLKFCRVADDLEKQANILIKKNDILHQTRDLLLPKLISGELDVSDLDIKLPEEVSA